MHPRKKNLTNVKMHLPQNTEAVLKFRPQVSSGNNKFSEGGPTDKDGVDAPFGVLNYVIEVAMNGYFLTIVFDDPEVPDLRFVLEDFEQVIHVMRGNFDV